MKILRGFKTELDLTHAQRAMCIKHAGAARYAYNWGLARKQAAYQAGQKTPNAIDLHKELNRLKQGELAWMYEVSKWAPQEALRNLDRAFEAFFRRSKKKKAGQLVGPVGFPRFKSRKHGIGSFWLASPIRVFERHIQLPRLGKLRLKERGYLPSEGVRILNAVVSEQAGHWYVAIQAEMDIPEPKPGDRPVAGVDLGLKTLTTVSDGTEIPNPKALHGAARKVKRLQRRMNRRVVGSANRKKAVRQLALAHRRVANIRLNALHQATSWLTRTKSAIGLEDLNVRGLLKNRLLAAAISDVGFGEFRRQVEYKGSWYGCRVVLADRFFPSSKRHAECGYVYADLQLSEREWVCPECGGKVQRDLNAALNLEQIAKTTVSGTGSNACGESVRPKEPAVLDEAGTERLLSGRKARTKRRPSDDGKSISTATAEAVREVVEGLRGRAKASANGSGKAHQPAPKPQFPAGITAVCPHCGDEPSTYTRAEAGWECGSCFKPVLIGVLPAEPRACPHCGAVVAAADTNFCDNCGQALE